MVTMSMQGKGKTTVTVQFSRLELVGQPSWMGQTHSGASEVKS